MQTFYITKYALTKGILKLQGRQSTDSPDMIVCSNGNYDTYYHGDEWYESERAARLKAEDMRKNKIASLKKQLEKLQTMEIKIKE